MRPTSQMSCNQLYMLLQDNGSKSPRRICCYSLGVMFFSSWGTHYKPNSKASLSGLKTAALGHSSSWDEHSLSLCRSNWRMLAPLRGTSDRVHMNRLRPLERQIAVSGSIWLRPQMVLLSFLHYKMPGLSIPEDTGGLNCIFLYHLRVPGSERTT